MKKLIVVCGEQNAGKTTVLNKLLQNGNAIQVFKKYRKKRGYTYGDFVCTINIKRKKVGIASKGDTKKLIDDGFSFISPYLHSIDVMICTCHKSNVNYIIKKYGMNSAIVIPKMVYNNNDNNLCLNEIIANI